MINLQKGWDIFSAHVKAKYRHPDWERTVELAREYKAFITGKDLEFMLRRFDRRESEADFTQANRIAQQITPAITSGLMNPARRLGKVKPTVDRMDYGRENDSKADQLRAGTEAFNNGVGFDGYMSQLVDPSDADPNGYVVLTFDDFDERYAKPTMYPVRIGCQNVFAAPWVNNELQYLYLGFAIRYEIQPAQLGADGTVIQPAQTAEGKRWAMYVDNHHIVANQVSKDAIPSGVIGKLLTADGTEVSITKDSGVAFSTGKAPAVYYFRSEKEILYEVTFFEQKSGRVPCFPVGCKRDPFTDGRTFVNRWHEAVPYLKKSLKQVRELDLTTALHAFPQKIQYVGKCRAKGCNAGYTPDGEACGTCHGTALTTIGSAQDHITFPLPKDSADMIDAAKLVHYVPLPVDLISQMRDIMKDTRSDAFRAVYGFDLFGDGRVGKTVEEVEAMNQSLYDALSPLASWRERTRATMTWVYAGYNDMAEGLKVAYRYPSNYGFETSAQLMAMMAKAKEAGAPTDYRASLGMKLVTATFSDDEVTLARVKTQTAFDPFPGFSEDAVLSYISGGKATERSALRYIEKATIFSKCEQSVTGPVTFYGLAETKQREIYEKVVDEMLAEMESNREPVVMPPMGTDQMLDDTNPDPNTSPDLPPEPPQPQ